MRVYRLQDEGAVDDGAIGVRPVLGGANQHCLTETTFFFLTSPWIRKP